MCVERSEIVEVAVELFGFLATLAVRILLAADDDCVNGD